MKSYDDNVLYIQAFADFQEGLISADDAYAALLGHCVVVKRSLEVMYTEMEQLYAANRIEFLETELRALRKELESDLPF